MKKLFRKLLKVAMTIVVIIAVVVAVVYCFPAAASSLAALTSMSIEALLLLAAKAAWVAFATFVVCLLIDPKGTIDALASVVSAFTEAATAVVVSALKPVVSAVGDVAKSAFSGSFIWLIGAFLAYKALSQKGTTSTRKELPNAEAGRTVYSGGSGKDPGSQPSASGGGQGSKRE